MKLSMSSSKNLPPEIIEQILYRLPAKSLGRFKCVSKPWLSLISNPQFIKTHLNRNQDHNKLILVSDYQSLSSVYLSGDQFINSAAATKVNFNAPICWGEIYSSCDGLVLASDHDNALFLLNPTTREFTKIPISPFAIKSDYSEIMYGLGYDSLSDDYKVVTISFDNKVYPENEYKPNCEDVFVNVYSVMSNSWRRVENSPYDHYIGCLPSGVFSNGCLHWLGCRVSYSSSVIAAFSLIEESFSEVPLPSSLDKGSALFYDVFLGECDGCLCITIDSLTHDPTRHAIHVWMMKEYGVSESWTEISIFELSLSPTKPIYFLSELEILLANDWGMVRDQVDVYNMGERSFRELTVSGAPASFEGGCTYIESLVSLKTASGIAGQ